MNFNLLLLLSICVIKTNAVRLQKLFSFIDGYTSEHGLTGFLHVGNEYTVYIKVPKPHDQYLYYELYESKNVPEFQKFKPLLLAVSKVPISYIKDQLSTYRSELYDAKYINENIVPGTTVKTLREWQIGRALSGQGFVDKNAMPVLRSIL